MHFFNIELLNTVELWGWVWWKH